MTAPPGGHPAPHGRVRADALTPAALTAALHGAGVLEPDNEVTAVHSGQTGGSGLVAEVRRLVPDYARPSTTAPRTLVAKSSASTAGGRALARVETRFYTDGLGSRAGLSTPALYRGEVDPRTGDSLLLIGDLGDDGFVRQIDGCTPEATAAALTQVARLHAFGFRAGTTPDLGWIPTPGQADVTAFCREWLTAWTSDWPAVLGDVPHALVTHFDRLAALLAGPPTTIVHGDFHSQNVHQGDGAVTLIDFQFVQRAVGVLDVARFLSTSLTTETRRRHESALLNHYREQLRAGGVEDGDAAGSVDHLRAALLWNLAVPLALHVREILTSGTSWPRTLPILERCVAAVDDWDALGVVTSPGVRTRTAWS